jgi:hypothetical protein
MAIEKTGRAVGNTTRAIDEAVQEFFTNDVVTFIDPHPTENAHRYGFEKLLRRLDFEHGLREEYLEIDRTVKVVRLKNKR